MASGVVIDRRAWIEGLAGVETGQEEGGEKVARRGRRGALILFHFTSSPRRLLFLIFSAEPSGNQTCNIPSKVPALSFPDYCLTLWDPRVGDDSVGDAGIMLLCLQAFPGHVSLFYGRG